jgi:dolichyl-phosphate-mannose--protein O-mannosyl transferase
MTNVRFSSRETDWKVLVALGLLVFSAVVGYLLPPPIDYSLQPQEYPPLTVCFGMRVVDAFFAVTLLVLVWGVFRLLEPRRRYSRTWVIAKTAGILLVWLLLVVALGFWFAHLHNEWLQQIFLPIREI